MLFVKSKENNTNFFTDLIKNKYQIRKKKNLYQISNSRVCQNSISPGESKFTRANQTLELPYF